MNRSIAWRGLIAVVFFIAGFALSTTMREPSPPLDEHDELTTVLVGEALPDFNLPDLTGRRRSADEWRGQVLVMNFWASWCPPCLEEIPHFIDLQARHGDTGLQFLGFALEDVEAVRTFADTLDINYPLLTGTNEVVALATKLGNQHGTLPYTVIVDREGRISFIKRGPVSLSEAQRVIMRLL